MQLAQMSVGGADLQIRSWGTSGSPVLFLHSLGPAGSAAFLDLAVQPILDAGFMVVAPDLPGFGGSAPLGANGYAVPGVAHLACAVAERLGWRETAVMGHSWGGAIACQVAASRPQLVTSLVLVDSGHIDYADSPGADLSASLEQLSTDSERGRLHADDREDVARQLEVTADDPLVDAFLEGLVDDGTGKLISRTLGTTRGAALYHLMRARQSETWPAIAAAQIPTLLLLATVPQEAREQNAVAALAFKSAVPLSDIRFVEGASHSLITDLREDFGAVVAEWLTVNS